LLLLLSLTHFLLTLNSINMAAKKKAAKKKAAPKKKAAKKKK
jgi:hypothetical protein